MILMVCLDDNNGMMFHKRRQSQDRIVRKKMIEESFPSKLWMSDYSYQQFTQMDKENIIIDNDFLKYAGLGEYCLVENIHVSSYEENIEKMILYRWNRKYPADFLFDIPLEKHGWKIVFTEDFSGFSHKKITKEVYKR